MHIEKESVYLIKRTIQKTGSIEIPAEGKSMYPFIYRGDLCRFILCETHLLKRGDVVLYYSSGNRLVAHRLSHVRNNTFIFKGDTNLGYDEPVLEAQILGKLTWIQHCNKKKRVDNFSSVLWGKLILNIPILPAVLRDRLNEIEK